VVFLAFVALAAAFTTRYDDHQIWRIFPENLEQLEILKGIETIPHEYSDFDFWKAASNVNVSVDIRVSPKGAELIRTLISGMNYNIHIANLQEHFEAARVTSEDGTWDNAYHDFNSITTWMTNAAAANPSFVSMFTLGKTYEGRTVYGLKITKGTGNLPQIYIDGGIHAREWMAPAVVQYIIGQFVNHSSTYSKELTSFEWYFVPVFNADGYVYTWTTDPNWRKNRQPNTGSSCVGTDPCRNADAGFGGQGSSNDPCSDTYHGTAAWSAPIMAAYRDYISALPRVKGYINFHSYDESWLDPYGYTANRPKDYSAQEANAKNCTDAIKAVHGQTYAYGPAYTTIYPASGVPSDWAYDARGVILSQAVELRGNSFQPSPTLIVPIGEEIIAGVQKLASDILGL